MRRGYFLNNESGEIIETGIEFKITKRVQAGLDKLSRLGITIDLLNRTNELGSAGLDALDIEMLKLKLSGLSGNQIADTLQLPADITYVNRRISRAVDKIIEAELC